MTKIFLSIKYSFKTSLLFTIHASILWSQPMDHSRFLAHILTPDNLGMTWSFLHAGWQRSRVWATKHNMTTTWRDMTTTCRAFAHCLGWYSGGSHGKEAFAHTFADVEGSYKFLQRSQCEGGVRALVDAACVVVAVRRWVCCSITTECDLGNQNAQLQRLVIGHNSWCSIEEIGCDARSWWWVIWGRRYLADTIMGSN